LLLKVGGRLRGAADATEVIVIRAPEGDVDLRCGGHPMTAHDAGGEPQGFLDPGFAGGTQLGKRYLDDESGLEVLCTKAGEGSLSIGTVQLEIKAPKPLPSSD
jgi:hypothetical protein